MRKGKGEGNGEGNELGLGPVSLRNIHLGFPIACG